MRLIDADELKKDIDKERLTPPNKIHMWKIIDNAPTVTPLACDLNFSINTIKSLCNSQLGCIDCPMKKNCNEFPPKWEEVKDND